MNLLARSALRVWTRRPAGPVLVALGVLAATLSAAGADLALAGAQQAERSSDAARLGERLARIRTPGGYTVAQETLQGLQARIVEEAPQRGPADARLPMYLAREATLTYAEGSPQSPASTTASGWQVLGLSRATLESLDLPVPGQGRALVDPGPREPVPSSVTARVQAAPRENVRITTGFQGQLAQTVLVGSDYQHSEDDDYVFRPNVTQGAKTFEAYLATAGNDTDFDLEVESPSGQVWLDDNGTAAQPQQPNVTIESPEGGNWTVRVHAKFARNEAFRLQTVQVFDARDARALGRLLQGSGFRAVGAQLGLTRLATLDLQLRSADLSTLGPAPGGLIVLPLDRLQTALDLEGQATGLIVRAAEGEDPLVGLPGEQRQRIEAALAETRAAASQLDPAQGLRLAADADRMREDRQARLDSTSELLFVALPAAVLAGILLATWAAGLHTRRLQSETTVLAGLGQSRWRSWALAGLHLGPAFLAGAVAALALSPFAGELIARGLGLGTASTPTPGLSTLATPALALVPVTGAVYASLRRAVRGRDPRSNRVPRSRRFRWFVAGASLVVAVVLAGLAFTWFEPARAFLSVAAAAAMLAWAVHWCPLWDAGLGSRALVVDTLGLFRTRSTHAALALAAAAGALVLAALVAGSGLSQAAQPDVESESGGYPVIAQTPVNVNSYAQLDGAGGPASDVLGQSVGVEFLMRVTGANIHSAPSGRTDTVYGIDTSFAQRHRHPVRSLDPDVEEPVRAVAGSRNLALVTTGLADRLTSETIEIRGPQGQLTYRVVGVLETRLLEGVYVSKEALPTHFNQIGGEQRIRLAEGVSTQRYVESLQTAFRDEGLTASTSQTLVERRLDGQQRAGRTLQGVAAVGAGTLLGLVALMGLRARAERRSSDAVLAALGARPRSIAVGIATETVLPVLVGASAGIALTLPIVDRLADLSELAFPLTPIDVSGVAVLALATAGVAVVLAVGVGAAVGVVAARGLDQQALRQIDG